MSERKAARGAPSTYSQEIADKLCAGIETGIPLAELCRQHEIGRTTVYDWQAADPTFAERIACARARGFDAIAERTRLTARGKADDEGGDSSGDVQRDKLIIDTDLKLLAKWDPRRYGDKTTTEVVGKDGGPIQTEVVGELSALPQEKRDAIRAAIKAAMG